MDFALTEEQELIVKTTRGFVEEELLPHEEEVERSGQLREDLRLSIMEKAKALGLYAFNMPVELGGGGLDTVSQCLVDRELGRANFALQYCVGRPSNILRACKGEQIERYLLPSIRGERTDCLAMTEPGAGSDLRSMNARAVLDGGDWVLNGMKHFISHADVADYAIVIAVTKVEETKRGPRKQMTSFLVDKGTPGFEVRRGPTCVSHRGYHQCELTFDNVRLPQSQVLGEVHKGFDVANEWLSSTRLQVAAMCLGRAHRALELCLPWAATRKQFGQPIGKFQGTSFKIADMAMDLELAELITLKTAWKQDHGQARDQDFAMAKVVSTEALGRIADHAIQIFGGMGLMDSMPLERFWRDARLERIWDGTSEIQRHIISRALLRPHEG